MDYGCVERENMVLYHPEGDQACGHLRQGGYAKTSIFCRDVNAVIERRQYLCLMASALQKEGCTMDMVLAEQRIVRGESNGLSGCNVGEPIFHRRSFPWKSSAVN
ncbi:MAG: hypothetical protein IJ708_02545 [Clostridia bacterium]|nr:hypothetical protein [Clostridia bacterium]